MSRWHICRQNPRMWFVLSLYLWSCPKQQAGCTELLLIVRSAAGSPYLLPARLGRREGPVCIIIFRTERCCHIVSLTSCGQCNRHWNAMVQRLLFPPHSPPYMSLPRFLPSIPGTGFQLVAFFHLNMRKRTRCVFCCLGGRLCVSQWATGNESMEQIHYWEADSSSASQDIPHILWTVNYAPYLET